MNDDPRLKFAENVLWLSKAARYIDYEDSSEYAYVVYKLAEWFEHQDYEAWSGEPAFHHPPMVMDYYTAIDITGQVGLYHIYGDDSPQMKADFETSFESLRRAFPQQQVPIREIEHHLDVVLSGIRAV